MLTGTDVINFGTKLVNSVNNVNDAEKAIEEYINYLDTFASIDSKIKKTLRNLPSKRFKQVLVDLPEIDKDRSTHTYYEQSSGSCGPSNSNSCGRQSSSHC